MNLINEELLQTIFELKLYNALRLQTTAGEDLRIMKQGTRNRNSGPDFLQAVVKIDDILLAGNIELHLRSSEWNRHGHSHDRAYDNVILHVVFEHDEEIYLHGKALPTLVLKDKIQDQVLLRYEDLLRSKSPFACERSIKDVPYIIQRSALDASLSARYERKAQALEQNMQQQSSLEEAFYHLFASSFGFGVNKHAFRKLAENIPLSILKKHAHSEFQLEALLYGQAGFLEDATNDYQRSLQKEYDFLKTKYALTNALKKHEWHFSKMHPMNFPTVRLAQLAALMHQEAHLFARVKELESLNELCAIFEVSPSAFWETHYSFDKSSTAKSKGLGINSIHGLIINAVCVLLYQLGKEEEKFRTRAEHFLTAIKPEENHITKVFTKAGMSIVSSFDSQAVIELHEQLCSEKRCMNCKIGAWILKA